MKILKTGMEFRVALLCAFFLLIAAFPGSAAEIDDSISKCSQLKNDTERLQCFDDLAKKQSSAKEVVTAITPEKTNLPPPPNAGVSQDDCNWEKCDGLTNEGARLQCFDDKAGKQISVGGADYGLVNCTALKDDGARLKCFNQLTELTVMERLWDLIPGKRHHSFVIRPYRSNYFLPVAYNSSPNDETNLEYDPAAKAQFNEAKFQLSFKAKIWEDFLQTPLQALHIVNDINGDGCDKDKFIKGLDLWIGYTQLSFWQLYNSAFSSPFRDTNYEPEGLLNIRTQYEIPGLRGVKLQFINVGFNHQSNGRSRPLSRSWNRIIANAGFEKNLGSEKKNSFSLQLKTWYRLPEDEADDDNPDLSRYVGYGELWATLYWKDMCFEPMLRNNLRQENMGAIQLGWSIPPSSFGKLLPDWIISPEWADKYLSDKFSLYFQYFNGYGEGLMDYNKSINRFSVGLMIAEWN